MNNRILQTDPLAGYLAQKEELDQAIMRVMNRGSYILGPETEDFECEFARYLQSDIFAVSVGSGTEALHLAMRTLGIGPGDGVLTVSHTAVATVAAIELSGAVPVLVDIDPVRMTMNPQALLEAIEIARSKVIGDHKLPKIKAIIPVHLYGQPADMISIMSIAERYNLFVIEDCAQAHGAHIQGRKVGTWGDIGAFSFYPTKNLGAFGDGGALVSKNQDIVKKAKLIRQYGWSERYISQEQGMNTRLDELQAAILRVRLKLLDHQNIQRRKHAAEYNRLLDGKGLIVPLEALGTHHVYHQYVVRTDRCDDLRAFLDANAVSTAIHYPQPVHKQPAYQGRISCMSMFETDKLCGNILSLPMHPFLTDIQVQNVCLLVQEYTNLPNHLN